jgi:hypothetical protein
MLPSPQMPYCDDLNDIPDHESLITYIINDIVKRLTTRGNEADHLYANIRSSMVTKLKDMIETYNKFLIIKTANSRLLQNNRITKDEFDLANAESYKLFFDKYAAYVNKANHQELVMLQKHKFA